MPSASSDLPPGGLEQKPDDARMRNARVLARAALIWERLWPLALPLVLLIAVFLSVSWLGLWPLMQNGLRLALLGLFGVAAVVALLPLFKLRWPGNAEIDNRIERLSGLDHRPVTAQHEQQARLTGDADPFSRALWQEHKRRMAASLTDLKAGVPVPKVADRDPYALRALVVLLLFVGAVSGWGEYQSRIQDAFRGHVEIAAEQGGRIDAWLTPPAYTNRPPIFLSRNTNRATVPEGSELVVRVLDVENPGLTLIGSDGESAIATQTPTDDKDGAKQDKSRLFKSVIEASAALRLKSGEKLIREWSVTVIPDEDPSIQFVEPPSASNRGALEFSYQVEDDYGVVAARAEIEPGETYNQGRKAVPLIEAPEIQLSLPRRRAREGTVKTSQDLTAHPWAGARVKLTLVAEDEAGQTGKSDSRILILPERIFTKPLALAVVYERRRLALDANAAQSVAEMLDIITDTRPEEFIKDFSTFTALRVAYRMIKRNDDPDELRDAVELLWETALAIEDGDLSLAERRLRDAQERLSKALENGATDKEIDELMKELRAAMDAFMRELAEQMARNPQNQQAMPLDPNTQVLRQQDLDRLMQQIEDLAKSGSRDAARQLLQELQRMMNNLQTARPGQNQRQTDEFSQQMNKLGEMMRKQQELMDQTFDMQRRQQQQQQRQRQGQQDQNRQGESRDQQQGQRGEQNQPGQQRPMTAEEFAQAMKELQRQQGELQRQMQELQDGLRGLGMEPGEQLGEAGEAMGEAEQQLGQGETGEATGQQGRALQAMREGAQQMMQNMQNQAGEQGRRGERGQHGQQSRGERDPLGRQSRSEGPQLGNDTKVPGEIDAQRARKILEAIRRKLGEATRPRLELDYLDRLLPTR